MPRQCTVCHHNERDAINRELAGNTAIPALAAKYRVSEDALLRHKANHLPAALAKAHEAGEIAHGDDLLQQVRQLRGKAISILLQAERAGDLKTALMGVREARACVELLLEVEGELNRAPQVNIIISPEWLRLRATIIRAMDPYPEARYAVLGALSASGGQP